MIIFELAFGYYNTPMSYTTLFFDLDDTTLSLQLRSVGGNPRPDGPLHGRAGWLARSGDSDLRRHYFETYGTTLRGLQKHHQVDTDDYLAYVHDLPLEEYIQPDPALHALLVSLPQRRFIFTNADAAHARRVMQVLGVADCFERIIDIRAIDFACKPELLAYKRALALAGDPAPQECVLLDDSPTNLAPARQLGFTTVMINLECVPDPAATYSIAISALHCPRCCQRFGMVLEQMQMSDKLISMQAAAELVPSGCTLALGGMTLYRRPMAFVRALVQRSIQTGEPHDLTLLAFTAGLECDLLVGAGMVSRVRTCYFGLEIFGSGAHVHLLCQPWRAGDHRRNRSQPGIRSARPPGGSGVYARARLAGHRLCHACARMCARSWIRTAVKS